MQRATIWQKVRCFDLLLFGGVTALITAGALLPTAALDAAPTLCLVKLAGSNWCPGCGMTHALSHLLHGRLDEALLCNWRVVFVAPLLAGAYAKMAWRIFKKARKSPSCLSLGHEGSTTT